MDYSQENKASFFARLKGRVSPLEMLKIETAYTLAKHGHRAQVRKELDVNGKPVRYFEHVRRVALIYIDAMLSATHYSANATSSSEFCENVCIALLHDTIEDTKDISCEMLEMIFGTEVARTVLLLTKTDGISTQQYLEKVASSKRALLIKFCDKLDNCRSLRAQEVGEEFRVKQKIETREHYMPLFQSLNPCESFHRLIIELDSLVKKS